MIKKIIFGKVKNGKFVPDSMEEFRKAFYFHEGKDVEITVAKKQKDRSLRQNKYYWKIVVGLISETTGEDKKRVHKSLCRMFLTIPDDSPLADVEKSSSELTTVEFNDYVANIQRWASEFLTCYIPDPNETDY